MFMLSCQVTRLLSVDVAFVIESLSKVRKFSYYKSKLFSGKQIRH